VCVVSIFNVRSDRSMLYISRLVFIEVYRDVPSVLYVETDMIRHAAYSTVHLQKTEPSVDCSTVTCGPAAPAGSAQRHACSSSHASTQIEPLMKPWSTMVHREEAQMRRAASYHFALHLIS
jgi:hypothetical protein